MYTILFRISILHRKNILFIRVSLIKKDKVDKWEKHILQKGS